MITQLIARLTAADTDYETIKHAWTIDGVLTDINAVMPIALFMPGPTITEPSPQMPIRQRATESVFVLTMCKWTELDGLRSELYLALLGYQHAASYSQLEHKSGEIKDITGEVVQWVDHFIAHRWITGTTP